MMDDIRSKIDPEQYGSLQGSSASFCLIDMVNNWLRTLGPCLATAMFISSPPKLK
jgi:hypothetical protein